MDDRAMSDAGAANGYTDIRSDSWVDRYTPVAIRPYLKLARLDRPIGTWLLLFPGWWSIALAAPNRTWSLPDVWIMVLFGVGAVVMRGAGCTINDILDRDIDRRVERTRARPLASGAITLQQALVFLGLQLGLGFLVLIQLTWFAIGLGVASLLLVFTYPLAKRVTWWPQAVLGVTFNWGALMGWAAVHDGLNWPPAILYVACVLWTLGYDTIYAHQDKEDDAKVGVKSSALFLGARSPAWVAGFYAATVVIIGLAGAADGLGALFFVGLTAGAAQLAWQVRDWIMDSQADCLVKFKSNRYFGWIMLASIILGSQPLVGFG